MKTRVSIHFRRQVRLNLGAGLIVLISLVIGFLIITLQAYGESRNIHAILLQLLGSDVDPAVHTHADVARRSLALWMVAAGLAMAVLGAVALVGVLVAITIGSGLVEAAKWRYAPTLAKWEENASNPHRIFELRASVVIMSIVSLGMVMTLLVSVNAVWVVFTGVSPVALSVVGYQAWLWRRALIPPALVSSATRWLAIEGGSSYALVLLGIIILVHTLPALIGPVLRFFLVQGLEGYGTLYDAIQQQMPDFPAAEARAELLASTKAIAFPIAELWSAFGGNVSLLVMAGVFLAVVSAIPLLAQSLPIKLPIVRKVVVWTFATGVVLVVEQLVETQLTDAFPNMSVILLVVVVALFSVLVSDYLDSLRGRRE